MPRNYVVSNCPYVVVVVVFFFQYHKSWRALTIASFVDSYDLQNTADDVDFQSAV